MLFKQQNKFIWSQPKFISRQPKAQSSVLEITFLIITFTQDLQLSQHINTISNKIAKVLSKQTKALPDGNITRPKLQFSDPLIWHRHLREQLQNPNRFFMQQMKATVKVGLQWENVHGVPW